MDNEYLGGAGLRSMGMGQAEPVGHWANAAQVEKAPGGELDRALRRVQSLRGSYQDLSDMLKNELERIGAGHLPMPTSSNQPAADGPSGPGLVPIIHCELDLLANILLSLEYDLKRLRTL